MLIIHPALLPVNCDEITVTTESSARPLEIEIILLRVVISIPVECVIGANYMKTLGRLPHGKKNCGGSIPSGLWPTDMLPILL
jgi:hypothetical protein